MNIRKILPLACLIPAVLMQSANATDRRDWGQKLTVPMRFEVLVAFNNEAVLDRETQVVWQATMSSAAKTWSQATKQCRLAMTGGRMGWRLPTLHELSALYDPFQEEGDGILAGPFHWDGSPQMFWTSTSVADDAYTDESSREYAYAVETFGRASPPNAPKKKNQKWGVWCVRGHSATDTY